MGKALVPFAFVFTPSLLFVNFDPWAFTVALIGIVIAVIGLGAAYAGYCRRPIGRPAFVALNLCSLLLVFGNPMLTLVFGAAVVAILGWHARPAVDESTAL